MTTTPSTDFHKFHRPEAGSHTVEGNVSGARAARLEEKRRQEQEEFERRKRQKTTESANSQLEIGGKFQPARIGGTVEEMAFRARTVGLVTAEEFLAASASSNGRDETPEQAAEREAAEARADAIAQKEKARLSKKKSKQKKKLSALLSFQDGEEEEEVVVGAVDGEDRDGGNGAGPSDDHKLGSKKDPTVDTSFLPDREREEQIQAERIRLEREWQERQIEIQKERLEITYSYWDGSGHRRACTITKGSSVGDFLEIVRKDLCREFKELANVASDALVYVKEDLILPHDITFYDLIVTKARGKSGPLFHFDVHDDVRVGPLDHRVEKDESHPGKVVERRWYEKNKHIFPASRWEVYDPAKTYGTYTIGGGIVTKKKTK
jgi:protein FAM50